MDDADGTADQATATGSVTHAGRSARYLQFGLTIQTGLCPEADPVAAARHAERLGFDLVTLHRAVQHGANPSFEVWTLLTWVAAHTTRVRVAPNVLALPHRHPAVLAKMAETLSRVSDGRLVLVLGAGAAINESAYHALSLAQRSAGEKVAALDEAIDIKRGLWSRSDVSYHGRHFQTEAATIAPLPSYAIPVWLGVYGARIIDPVGRKADGWLPSLPFLAPERAYQKRAHIRQVALETGRNPDDLTYAYNVPVFVASGQVAGSAAEMARQLADVAQHGVTRPAKPMAGRCGRQPARTAGPRCDPTRPRSPCSGFRGRSQCAQRRRGRSREEVGAMQLMALLTCPTCGGQTAERMPTNACAVRYTCGRCGVTVRPRPGDCCVFCSYGNVPCPPIQCAQEDQARQA